MKVAGDVLLALLAAFGLVSIGWWAFGRIVSPAGASGRVYTVLPAAGDGAELEQTVTALLWLRGSGGLVSAAVLVADCGLTEEGRQTARTLARRMPDLHLCRPEELQKYIFDR